MLPYATELAAFIRVKQLGVVLLYLVRHPLTNIRSLQSWIRTRHHEYSDANSSVSLARSWRRAALVYLRATPGSFAGHMRYEDFLMSPVQALQSARTALFSRNQASLLPAISSSVLQKVISTPQQLRGQYTHATQVCATYSNQELGSVLMECGLEMSAFGYSACNTFPVFANLTKLVLERRNAFVANKHQSAHTRLFEELSLDRGIKRKIA